MKCSNCNKLEIEIDKHKNCLKIKEATIDVQKGLIEDLRKDNLFLLAKLNKKYFVYLLPRYGNVVKEI